MIRTSISLWYWVLQTILSTFLYLNISLRTWGFINSLLLAFYPLIWHICYDSLKLNLEISEWNCFFALAHAVCSGCLRKHLFTFQNPPIILPLPGALWSLQIKLIMPSSDLPLSGAYFHPYLLVWAFTSASQRSWAFEGRVLGSDLCAR